MDNPADQPALETEPRAVRFEQPVELTQSYRRPHDNGVVIRKMGRYRYVVAITDKPIGTRQSHYVELYRVSEHEDTQFEGRCSCKGWQYHAGPCAHLWGVKLAASHETVEIETLRDAIDSPGSCPACGFVTTRGNK